MRELNGTERHDVVIVGGGVIGLACAWRAAERGLDVCVLERGRPGDGASTVAAGMLAPVTEAEFGEQPLLELTLAAARSYPGFVDDVERASGLEVDFRQPGSLFVALDRDEASEIRRLHAFRETLGLATEWLTPRRCRELEPGLAPSCAGGALAPGEAAVDPRTLVPALARAVDTVGGRVISGADVAAAEISGGRLTELETADGRRFAAPEFVLAAGCWSGSLTWLPPEALPPVRPVKGQLVLLAGPAEEPLCTHLLRTSRVYVVPRAEGRVVVGATVEEHGFDTTVTAGAVLELLREAYRALPDVAELELVEALAGLRPGTPDNGPLVGRGALDGLVLATGHYRNGILLAPVTADAVAALLVGEEPPAEIAHYSPGRFRVGART